MGNCHSCLLGKEAARVAPRSVVGAEMWEDGEPTAALWATPELLPCWVGMGMAGPTSLMTQTASNENPLPRLICMFSESDMEPAGSATVCP